jgi:hypothetical protein
MADGPKFVTIPDGEQLLAINVSNIAHARFGFAGGIPDQAEVRFVGLKENAMMLNRDQATLLAQTLGVWRPERKTTRKKKRKSTSYQQL